MPCVDMPLEKLREYQGINPRPADFDEFWDRSLAELSAIDPAAAYKPLDFPSAVADFYELTFTSTKGARIYAKFARPKNASSKLPAVLIFHGLGGCSPEWKDLLPYVSQAICLLNLILASIAHNFLKFRIAGSFLTFDCFFVFVDQSVKFFYDFATRFCLC